MTDENSNIAWEAEMKINFPDCDETERERGKEEKNTTHIISADSVRATLNGIQHPCHQRLSSKGHFCMSAEGMQATAGVLWLEKKETSNTRQ